MQFPAITHSLTTYLEETLGYADVRSARLYHTDGAWGVSWYAYDDTYDTDAYQGWSTMNCSEQGADEVWAEILAHLKTIPAYEERQLRILAGKMAEVVTFSKETEAVAARAYGEAFAARLNELRTLLTSH